MTLQRGTTRLVYPHSPIRAYGRQGGGTFDPSQVTGLAAWWDFSDVSLLWQDSARTTPVTANTDPIGSADDKSGGGFHLTQATAGNRLTYATAVQNGHSIGRTINLNNTYLANASSIVASQPVFIIGAFKVANTNNRTIWDGGDGTHRCLLWYGVGTPGDLEMSAGSLISAAHTPGSWHVYEHLYSGASSVGLVDGSGLISGSAGTQALGSGFILGEVYTLSALTPNADFGEIIIYSTTPSAGDRTSLRAWLKAKWGTP